MSLLIAMLIDTWRELTSRFLFWIVLAISAIIVLLLTSVGFDETGISLWWGLSHSEHDLLRRGTRNLNVVYRAFFSDVLVGFWLTYAATFLGLISTASVCFLISFRAAGSTCCWPNPGEGQAFSWPSSWPVCFSRLSL